MRVAIAVLVALVALACSEDSPEAPELVLLSPTSPLDVISEDPITLVYEARSSSFLTEVALRSTPPDLGIAVSLPLSGRTLTDTLSVNVPATAPSGTYTLGLVVRNEAGGEARIELVLNVTQTVNSGGPSITLSSPGEGASFGAGASVPVSGTVADSDGLNAVQAVLRAPSGTLLDEATQSFSGETSANFSETLVVPSNASAGTYTLSVSASDNGTPPQFNTLTRNLIVP